MPETPPEIKVESRGDLLVFTRVMPDGRIRGAKLPPGADDERVAMVIRWLMK